MEEEEQKRSAWTFAQLHAAKTPLIAGCKYVLMKAAKTQNPCTTITFLSIKFSLNK